MDRLVAELGTPPDVGARRRRWCTRLPISIRIDGPERELGLASRATRRWRGFRPDADGDWLSAQHRRRPPRRSSASAPLPWQREPHGIGWITLALLLG